MGHNRLRYNTLRYNTLEHNRFGHFLSLPPLPLLPGGGELGRPYHSIGNRNSLPPREEARGIGEEARGIREEASVGFLPDFYRFIPTIPTTPAPPPEEEGNFDYR